MIINTLKPSGVPVKFQDLTETEKKSNPESYITFFEYNQRSAANADDEEALTNHYIQVDVWSKGDYTNLVKQVKNSLKSVGFNRTFETELYEPDTKTYHKVIRLNYITGGN
ncbi:tail completion protein gp17 [Bacillus infantis]|uniref:tail completion protein gp17 n=1 Tax=Bacillus infantis TaxID=324767 RepID=UPI003CF2B167